MKTNLSRRERRAKNKLLQEPFVACNTTKRDRSSKRLSRLGRLKTVIFYQQEITRLETDIAIHTTLKASIGRPATHPDWKAYWNSDGNLDNYPDLKFRINAFNKANRRLIQGKAKLERFSRFMHRLYLGS